MVSEAPSDARRGEISYLVRAVLAGAALYFAQGLSAGDRGPVDWIVIGLLFLALCWNLVKLGRRLHAQGGARDLWHLQRTLLFWIVGLMNTVLRATPAPLEGAGSWKQWVGWLLLIAAAFDTLSIGRKERAYLLRGGEPAR